ncbi:hypothetical protein ACXYUI_32650, partial [Klebsiella pneumoniae]
HHPDGRCADHRRLSQDRRIIGADLWKLAQAPLNATLRLEPCELADALAAADAQQRYLDSIRATVAALDWSRATLYKK